MCFLRAVDRAAVGSLDLRGDFRFGEGISALFGPSGAGKTTLLHMLAGLARPDSGRIECGGEVLFDSVTGACVAPERRRIGVVFQDLRLFPHLDVRANLRFGAGAGASGPARAPGARRGSSSGSAALSEARVIDVLELNGLLDRGPAGLSGGEARRVALGRALLAGPRVLLLDEPTAGLDEARRQAVLGLLERVHAEFALPMVLVSHSLPEILQLTRDLVVLEDGRLLADGPLRDVLGTDRVFRLAHELGLESVLEVRVERVDHDARVVRARVGGERLALPFTDAEVGRRALVAVRPEDVIVARGPVPAISAQNALSGTVEHVTEVADRRLVTIRIGGAGAGSGDTLRAEITHGSARELGVEPGQPVTCLVKVFSFRWRRWLD